MEKFKPKNAALFVICLMNDLVKPCWCLQAGERWRSFDGARRERFIVHIAKLLSHPRVTNEVRRLWIGYWSQCDAELGKRIAARLHEAGKM